ncbi:hypothetical protein QFC22_002454, partial [Naganishia vaughanmartiniae]
TSSNGNLHSPNNDHPDIQQKPDGQKPNKSFLALLPQSYLPTSLPSIPSFDAVSTGVPQSYSDIPEHYGGQRVHSAGAAWHPKHAPPYLHLNGQMHSAPPTADNSFQAFQAQSSRFHQSAVPPVTAPPTLPHEYAAFQPDSPFQAMQASEPGPLQHQQSRFPTHQSQDGQSTAPIFPLQTQQPYLMPITTSAPYQLPSMRPTLHFQNSFSDAQGNAMYSPAPTDGNQQPYYFPPSDSKSEQGGASTSDPAHSQGSAAEQQQQTVLAQAMAIDPTINAVPPQMMYPAIYDSAGLTGPTSQEYNGQNATRFQMGVHGSGSSALYRPEIIDIDYQNEESSTSRRGTDREKETPTRSVRPRGKPGPKPEANGSAKGRGNGEVDTGSKTTGEERPKKKSKKRAAADDSDEVTGVKANGKGNQFILTLYG